MRAIVEHDGGDYERVKQVTIGFNAVSRLLTKRVDAVPAFWNAEGVALQQRGLAAREFRVEDYGAPPYPEVVLVTARKTLAARAGADRARAGRDRAGLQATRSRPDEAVDVIARAAETDDTALVRAQLDAVLPIFADGLRLDRDVLEQWADFDARIGLVKERPDVRARVRLLAARPLNAGRPNPVTVRAASDLGGGHWPPGFRAENGESVDSPPLRMYYVSGGSTICCRAASRRRPAHATFFVRVRAVTGVGASSRRPDSMTRLQSSMLRPGTSLRPIERVPSSAPLRSSKRKSVFHASVSNSTPTPTRPCGSLTSGRRVAPGSA